MRIAIVVSVFPSISETFVLNHITALIERGHDVTIFSRSHSKDNSYHADIMKFDLLKKTVFFDEIPDPLFKRFFKGVPLFFKSFLKQPLLTISAMNFFKWGKEALSLRNLYYVSPFIGRGGFDAVHCHFGPNGILALYAKRLGLPIGKLIVNFHGYDAFTFILTHGEKIYEELFEKADAIISVSEFLRERLEILGCPKEKIFVIPASFDISKYPFRERGKDKENILHILSVGRLVEVKGTEFGILAVEKALREKINVRYSIIGNGPMYESLQKLINEKGLSEKIKLLGEKTIEEVRNYMENSHILIQPSIRTKDGVEETQALAVQEAQAMGIPVIASRIGGIPEGLVDGKSGFLVPEKDPDAIFEKIKYLADNPERMRGMGIAGRDYVEKKYDINKNIMVLEKLYRG